MTIISPSPVLEENNFSEDELELLLDYIFELKTDFIQDFLSNHEPKLPYSGIKSVLRKRILGYLSSGEIRINELTELLNKIEGWGRQHIYFYLSPEHWLNIWREEDRVLSHLSNIGKTEYFNRPRPLILPKGILLSSIEWTTERARIIWVDSHRYEVRTPNQDIEEKNMIWKAYEVKNARRLTTFDWDLDSGEAMLMIQSMPKGADYFQVKKQIENQLEEIIPISQFEQTQVSKAIRKIEESTEVRRRWLSYDTLEGGRAEFRSRDWEGDTYLDPALYRANLALKNERAGFFGDFYWNPVDGILDNEFHVKVYAQDQRVYVYGQHKEHEVRYAISRIRSYC